MDVADHVHPPRRISPWLPSSIPRRPITQRAGIRPSWPSSPRCERRSGLKRRVEGYVRVLWPFDGGFCTPAEVTPAYVLAWGRRARVVRSRAVVRHRRCSDRQPELLLPVPHSRCGSLGGNPGEALERPKGCHGQSWRSLWQPRVFEHGRGAPNGASWRPFWRPFWRPIGRALSARAGPVGSEC
jgi:hypothetical protein